MSRGKHAAESTLPSLGRVVTVTTGAGLATLAGVPLASGIALADGPSSSVTLSLQAIADCESGKRLPNGRAVPNTSANVENAGPSTASGHLQFVDGTWAGHGGREFAGRAIGATRDQQFEVGRRTYAAAGNSFRDWNASRSCWGDTVNGIMNGGGYGTSVAVTRPPVPPPAARPAPARLDVPRLPHGNKNGVVECVDFIDQAEVTAFFQANDPARDPFNLDRDDDGQACEVWFANHRHAEPPPPPASASTGRIVSPMPGAPITTQFNPNGHPGTDLDGVLGQRANAAADVTVVQARTANGFGNIVVARATIDGQTVDFLYGHMNALQVKVGDTRRAGEQIIQVGNAGTVRSSGGGDGSHLHFEVWIGGYQTGKPVNPVTWLAQHGSHI